MLTWHQRVKQPPLRAFALVTLVAVALTAFFSPSLSAVADGDPIEHGRFLFSYQGCIDCHGPNAEGDVGPKISALDVSLDEFMTQLRTPKDQMDPYPPELLNDADAADLYTFLQSLP